MWIVQLTLEPTNERLAARPTHREVLAQLQEDGIVRMAGPYVDDSGALIILDLPDRAAVEDVLAGDPYYKTPGVTIDHIREWRPFIT